MAKNPSPAGAMDGNTLMQLLGLEKSRFHELVGKGIIVKVGRGTYNGALSIRQYCQHLRDIAAGRTNAEGLDIVAEGARLKRVQADKAEFQLAILRGEYLPADEINDAFTTVVLATQSAILGTTATAAKDFGFDRAQSTRHDEIMRDALKLLAQEGERIAINVQKMQTSKLAHETDEATDAPAETDQQGFDFGENET